MLYRTWMCSLLVAAGLPVTAFAQSVAGSHQNEERAIRAADASFLSAVGAHDINKIAAAYAPEAVVINPNAPAATGVGIRKSWSDLFALPGETVTWTPTRVDVAASGDMASEIGTYQMSYTGPNGKVTDGGNFVTVWRKYAGQWKILTDADISNTPMNATMSSATVSRVPAEMLGTADMEARTASALTWTNLEVPGFTSGTKMAVLHGDPSKAGEYVMRLQFPDGYEFPLHWHPSAEQITVISGTFHLAMESTTGQGAPQTYAPGDFVYIPSRMAHAGGAKGVTVVQLHGTGPFAINLGSPK